MKDLFSLASETTARDAALNSLERSQPDLIAIAHDTAVRIARASGRVTSTEVLAALTDAGFGPQLADVDRRFMGAVFRKGWTRLGFETTGSHRRPVSIWALKN